MPKPYENPTGKQRAVKKNDRLLARENWASGLTDVENAKVLNLFKENGEPNAEKIARWRKQSTDPEHRTYRENWYVYRDQIEADQIEDFLLQRRNYERSRLAEMLQRQKDFDRSHYLTVEMFDRMLRTQFTPQKSPDGQLIMPRPDREMVKTLMEGYNLYRQIAADKQKAVLPSILQDEILALAADAAEELEQSGFDELVSKMNQGDIEIKVAEQDPAYFASLQKHSKVLNNLIELSAEKKKATEKKTRLSS